MDFISIFAIAVGLCFDTFAVSLSCGVVQYKILFRQALRLAFVLAVFQGGLTIGGYFLGSVISGPLKAIDHWIALGLLSSLGVKMIIDGFKSKEERAELTNFTSPLVLVSLALGTSIDAFAVGISFALLDVRIWISGLVIGIVTFIASMTAIRIGKSTGEKLELPTEILGGLILIAIGLKIFIEHLLSS